MAKAVPAIDLEIAAELNPEAPETSVDVEALRRKFEEEYIRLEMIRVDLEAQRRKIEEDNIQGMMIRADLESEQIAELNPEEPTVDLEARRRKMKEDYKWAKMRADAEARQRQMDEDYNRVKHLLWVVEKPFILLHNFIEWLLEKKLDPFQEKPRRRKIWVALGGCSCIFTLLFGKDLELDYDNYSIMLFCLHLFYDLSMTAGYPWLLFYLYHMRDPLHYVIRRSHKQLLESTLVLVSSSWVYYTTDDILELSMTGPFLCFDLIPCLNLWWNFDDNFGFFDCCLFILIEAALICCRHRGLVVLMAVTVVGLTLQFIKNAYRHYHSHKIKNQTLDHLV